MNNQDCIRCMNVYSKVYSMPYTEIQGAFKDFTDLIKKYGIKLMGNVFYSVNKLEENGDIEIEIFYPASKKAEGKLQQLNYRNYFVVENMLSVVVENNHEKNTPKAYAAIANYAASKKLKIISPFYNEIHKNGKNAYLLVKAAVG